MYEGYILYPYRAPRKEPEPLAVRRGHVARVRRGRPFRARLRADRVRARAHRPPSLDLVIRFLQVQRRTGAGPSWDEAVEREVAVTVDAAQLLGGGECVTDSG